MPWGLHGGILHHINPWQSVLMRLFPVRASWPRGVVLCVPSAVLSAWVSAAGAAPATIPTSPPSYPSRHFFFDFRSPFRPDWCYYYDCLHICRSESADKLRGEFINLRVAAIRWLPRLSRTCHSYTCFHSKSINLARRVSTMVYSLVLFLDWYFVVWKG